MAKSASASASFLPQEEAQPQPEKKANMADFLKSASKKTEAKPKSKTPLLTVPVTTMELAQKVRKLKDGLDSIQSVLTMREAELLLAVEDERVKICTVQGYTSSLKIPTPDGNSVMITYSSNWKKCSIENEDRIIGIIGQEKYDKYFGVTNKISVKAEIPPEELAELIEKIGTESFLKYFDVEANIRPKEMYKTEQFTQFSPHERKQLTAEGSIEAYKPSVKVR